MRNTKYPNNIESHDEKSMEDPQGSDKENETLNSFENDKKSFERSP